MNGEDREQIRETVGEAVEESVALELVEELGPLIHGAVDRSLLRWTRFMVLGFLLLAIAFGVLWHDARGIAESNRQTAANAEREARIRVNQTCALFEADHLRDVDQLGETYRYLLALRAGERKTTFNRFIIAGLPDLEAEARVDKAPDYCDEPKVGLPEPDPVIPRRPEGLPTR